jgi:hypothetical protein
MEGGNGRVQQEIAGHAVISTMGRNLYTGCCMVFLMDEPGAFPSAVAGVLTAPQITPEAVPLIRKGKP